MFRIRNIESKSKKCILFFIWVNIFFEPNQDLNDSSQSFLDLNQKYISKFIFFKFTFFIRVRIFLDLNKKYRFIFWFSHSNLIRITQFSSSNNTSKNSFFEKKWSASLNRDFVGFESCFHAVFNSNLWLIN